MKRLTFLFIYVIASGITALSAQTAGFRQEGIASWYGAEFAGRPTASGEIFDPRLMTAAHPSLPFGTVLKVTNLQNNRQAVVRVNDRGPFVAARIIDISQGAAEILDIVATGTAPVRIETLTGQTAALSPSPPQAPQARTAPAQPVQALSPAQAQGSAAPQIEPAAQAALSPQAPQVPQARTTPTQPVQALSPIQTGGGMARIIPGPAESSKIYRLQVGSYKLPRNAVDAFERLKSAGLEPAYEQYGEMYRVVLVGVRGNDIQSMASTLGRAGFSEVLIREER
ncbi:MAG: septal ring lytic transglycosylase RlpA family protein [Spirochaetaceae bacterium]|nr:septal ring lytic transglycosylase RlpA family protein [Spirochaetaceae bacterium]